MSLFMDIHLNISSNIQRNVSDIEIHNKQKIVVKKHSQWTWNYAETMTLRIVFGHVIFFFLFLFCQDTAFVCLQVGIVDNKNVQFDANHFHSIFGSGKKIWILEQIAIKIRGAHVEEAFLYGVLGIRKFFFI